MGKGGMGVKKRKERRMLKEKEGKGGVRKGKKRGGEQKRRIKERGRRK